jgi:hypothetical protein
MAEPLPGVLRLDTNPGAAPPQAKDWPPTQWDHLPLPPPHGTVGDCPTDLLRRVFHKLGLPESHSLGRETLCRRFRDLLSAIGGEASDRAITEFLAKHKD